MTIDEVLGLVRPHLLKLQPYSSARDEFDQSVVDKDQFIYLDANENPFDTGYNRYPDPHQHALKLQLSEIKNISAKNIFLGNGSDEAIDLLIRLFCDGVDENILIPSPTYGMYKVSAEINHVPIKTLLLTETFNLPDNLLESTDQKTKIIFLCSPNNPSGNLLDPLLIEDVVRNFKGIVVVDEAYIDFTGKASWISKLDQYPNLVVLQTLSKAWGLAGLRLGMAFAHPQVIVLLNKIKPPYNISEASQRLGLQAFAKIEAMKISVVEIVAERARLAKELAKLTSVQKVFPSDANFLLVRTENAAEVYKRLVTEHIIVRDRSQVKRCEDCLRITVGTKEENDQLLKALRKIS